MISPVLICYHRDHSPFCPLFVYNSSDEKPGSAISLLNSSILVYMYSGFRILNPPIPLHQLEVLLSFICRLHSFPELLRSAPFSLIFVNEVVSYMCNTVRLFSHILHSILRPSHILNDLRVSFFYLYPLRLTLCYKALRALTNVWCHISTMTVSYTTVSIS